jgi:putative peptidoglycan lipid II flippase
MLAVVSGLALDVVIALSFGVGSTTDAFFVAARLPVGVVMVLLSGASLGLVPVFSRIRETHGAAGADAVSTSVLALVLLGGTAIATLVALAAPAIVSLLAPGLDPQTLATASMLLRILVLVMPLTAWAEVLRSIANARDSFALPAAANIALNLVAASFILATSHRGVVSAAWAYVAGGIARIVVLVVWNLYLGWRPVWRASGLGGWRDTTARSALALSVRPSAGAGLAPLVRIVEGIFASFLPVGSITILNYGYRLIFAISGTVVFRSILGVLLPGLTRAAAAKDEATERRLTGQGIRAVVLLAGLLTGLLISLGEPGAALIFNRGRVDPAQIAPLGFVLAGLALSLIPEGIQRTLQQPFYARLDTRSPLRNSLLGAGINIALIPLLVAPFAGAQEALFGIVAAFVLADWIAAVDAWRRWRALTGHTLGISRLAMALTAGIAVSVALGLALSRWWGLSGRTDIVGVGLVGLASVLVGVVYFVVTVALDPALARRARRRLKKRG